ncbi:unnamed protein product [Cylicostephanus goldi]|uniref:Uncharacterized protein n=1 Tax=Cylicostephanus goldi TaxID=71465 RepID=A0A3P7QTR2_CYLGO|nr:unnamed protein product [Cylicostephanus goldi]
MSNLDDEEGDGIKRALCDGKDQLPSCFQDRGLPKLLYYTKKCR